MRSDWNVREQLSVNKSKIIQGNSFTKVTQCNTAPLWLNNALIQQSHF